MAGFRRLGLWGSMFRGPLFVVPGPAFRRSAGCFSSFRGMPFAVPGLIFAVPGTGFRRSGNAEFVPGTRGIRWCACSSPCAQQARQRRRGACCARECGMRYRWRSALVVWAGWKHTRKLKACAGEAQMFFAHFFASIAIASGFIRQIQGLTQLPTLLHSPPFLGHSMGKPALRSDNSSHLSITSFFLQTAILRG